MKYVVKAIEAVIYTVPQADSETHAWELINESIDEGDFNRYVTGEDTYSELVSEEPSN